MNTVKVSTTQHIDIEYDVAGVGERIVAYCIDLAIWIGLFLLVLFLSMATLIDGGGNGVFVALGVFFLLFACYDLACEVFFNGQSVGKRSMKIRVVSIDGKQPSLGQYLLRWMFRLVDMTITSGVGAVLAISVTDRKQRLGDIVANTTVIRTEPRVQLGALAFRPVAEDTYEPTFPEVKQLSDAQVQLVYDVLANYQQSFNYELVVSMASKIKENLGVTLPEQMDDLKFLSRVVKDYTHLTAQH